MNTPIVLLPGLMCDSRLFEPQINILSRDRTVIVAPVSGFNSVREIASNLLDSLPNKFILAGLSFGGIVALEILKISPKKIKKLVLIDTSYFSEQKHISEKRKAQIKAVQNGDLERVMIEEHIPNYLSNYTKDTTIAKLCKEMALNLGAEIFIQQSRALIGRNDQTEVLENIEIPTLLLCGEHDKLCPVSVHQKMHKLIKKSSLSIIPKTGHLPTLENPDLTNRILLKWLK